jgi:PAS domain S-box-containing protein
MGLFQLFGKARNQAMDAPANTDDEIERLRRENLELRARLADFESLFTMIPVPIAVSDEPDATNVEVNPAFAALLGVDTDTNVSSAAERASDLPFRFLADGKPLRPEDLPLRKAARTRQEVRAELEIVRDDGLRYYIYGSAKPIFDEAGYVRRAFGAFIDISDRKRAERALQQSMDALSKANEELQQFAYAASHDLQEPLRTIASFTQLLERRHSGDSEGSEYAALIVEGVSRMNTLISDLLQYSRIGAAADLKRTPVELGNALQWALLNLDRSIRDHQATVHFDALPEVVANESQMVQLFQNLVGNSLKYKGDLAPVIQVGAEETEEEWVISVRDNGMGIEPQYNDRIFGVFKRLHGRDIPGTGIGLAICRKIVENHGGRIWVESDGKNGSNFRFTLPKE